MRNRTQSFSGITFERGSLKILILKIQFTSSSELANDVKDAKTLCRRISQNFHLQAKPQFDGEKLQHIVLADILGDNSNTRRKINDILDYCDSSDFGRVYEHAIFEEQIDNLLEDFDPSSSLEYDR